MSERRRLAAIVATDVADFSRLMGEDESGTLEALMAHRAEVIDPALAEHGGRVVKTMGDGLLLEFPSVVDAVRFTVRLQEGIARRGDRIAPVRALSYRIGVHLGDVIVEGDDLFGEGVNVAARLQAIAQPGGICLSQHAFDEVRDKLPFEFRDGGERKLKNIVRPVHVWHWVGAKAATPEATAAGAPALALPDRPSIAVLPFVNMSGDAEQEYLADGITEDLITELSRFGELFVIARNSTFVFKGQAVDIQEVGRKLGVRYVVEGSVRRAGQRVRVSAQLIEAATNRHLWAERYDRDLADIYAAQDDVTRSIVAAVAPTLSALERARARRAPCCNTSAWDVYQRGLWHVYRYSPEDLASARTLFGHAIEIDGQFAPAHAGLAYALYAEVLWGYATDATTQLGQARRAAARAVALDPRDAFAHVVLGRVLMTSGEVHEAVTECELAVKLNPNLAGAHYGLAYSLALAGRCDDALASVERAVRLSPFDPLMHAFLTLKCALLIMLGRLEQAVGTARNAQRQPSATVWAHLMEASALALLGRSEEARTALQRGTELQPDVSLHWLKSLLPALPDAKVEVVLEGMRKAGLPD